ncbi:MAG: hypothetical protein ABSA71_00445 [Desulfomonilia bacterium]
MGAIIQKKEQNDESCTSRSKRSRDPFSEFYHQIEEKYKDILSISTEDEPYEYVSGIGDLYEKIFNYEIPSQKLNDFLSKVSCDLKPLAILDIKAAIADCLGDMIETYRYESTEEGHVIEDYLDGLLEIVRKYEISAADMQNTIASTHKIKVKKKEIPGAGRIRPKQAVLFD